jgi:hypothetical protein
MDDAPRCLNEPRMVESQAGRTTMARADARPQLRGGDKSDWFVLRREMLLRMAALEKMIPNLRASVANTADNRAPDSIKLIPFCDWDIAALEALLAILEALPPPPTTATTQATEAATRLNSFGGWIKAHVARQADMFVSKASKSAGPDFRKSDIRLLFRYVFADKMLAAAQAALDCLNWPMRPASWTVATEGREIHLQRFVFFEKGAVGMARPIKQCMAPHQARRSTMSRAPRARPVLRVSG